MMNKLPPIFSCQRPDADEVQGHVAAGAMLRCWECREAFPIPEYPREDVFYSCTNCRSLNQPDLTSASDPNSVPPAPAKPPGSYTPPKRIESVFLRNANGELFELSRQEAEAFQIKADRLHEIGHPPYILPAEEVAGHHKTPAGTASDPGTWEYHCEWEHGCYLDADTGEFFVGMHRHPYGDERAVGALPQDFS